MISLSTAMAGHKKMLFLRARDLLEKSELARVCLELTRGGVDAQYDTSGEGVSQLSVPLGIVAPNTEEK